MDVAVQVLPLCQHLRIALHHRHRLSPLEAVALELVDEVVKNQSVGTLGAVFRQNAYQQQVDGIGVVAL